MILVVHGFIQPPNIKQSLSSSAMLPSILWPWPVTVIAPQRSRSVVRSAILHLLLV